MLEAIAFSPEELGFTSLEQAQASLEQASASIQKTNRIDLQQGLIWQFPFIEEGSYVDAQARLIGGIYLHQEIFIAPFACIRMDEKYCLEPLEIFETTNIQDHVLIHAQPTQIGPSCIIAHSALLHGCTLGRGVTVYLKSVIDTGATISDGCFIDACAYIGRNVCVPSDRYIEPYASVLTNEAAEALPQVTDQQREIQAEVLQANASHVKKYHELNLVQKHQKEL